MEAPNKIYLSPKSFEIGEKFNGILTTMAEGDIEYIRTDAFIEKACKWLKEHVLFTHPRKGIKVCAVNLIAFVDAMKGE